MKTKLSAFAIAMLAALLCGSAIVSYAQGPEGHPGGMMMGGPGHAHMGMMMHELNLTDAQKQQVHTMMEAVHSKILPIEQQMAQNRIAMLQATTGGTFDQAKVQALAAQQAQLQAQMTVQHEALASQVYNQVLTPEQRTKADQLRADEITHIQQHIQEMSNGTAATQ